jgi:hypothetical protein
MMTQRLLYRSLVLGLVYLPTSAVWIPRAFAGDERADMTAFAGECKAIMQSDFALTPDAPTQITSAEPEIAADGLPSYCRVRGYVAQAVGFEFGLPLAWNGKFMEGGCGGHCGMETFRWSCAVGLRKGYACIVSDMGHTGISSDGLWAYQNLQAKVDWGYRATHEVAIAGKVIAAKFYSRPPAKSYYMGCSTGGRQGLQEAQRFPWDFDGVIAGAPPVNLSNLYLTLAWEIQRGHDQDGRPLLGEHELNLLSRAAVAKCDLDDGVPDGVIGNPLACRFDPGDLTCRAGSENECLTPRQVEVARQIYAGPTTSNGQALTRGGGPLPGSEQLWTGVFAIPTGGSSTYSRILANAFRYLFF